MRSCSFFLVFISVIGLIKHSVAQDIFLKIVDSSANKPIENVYLYDSKNGVVSISDSEGLCTVNKDLGIVNISHIGYVPIVINLSDSNSSTIKVHLVTKIFEISEVIVSTPNARYILQKAISRIDSNYNSFKDDTVGFHTKFSFFDSPQNKIADFDGKIAISKKEKGFIGAIYSITKDYIDDVFFDYSNEISPNGFYSIIPIRRHSPIRLNKKFEFDYGGSVIFRGHDVHKIAFSRNGKYSNVNGYMFINKEDYAIVYMCYELGKIDKWIAATSKGNGLVFSNLKKCQIEVEYQKYGNGYVLSDGNINMKFDRTNKKQKLSENTYEVSLKFEPDANIPSSLIYYNIDELFKKK